MPDWFSQFEGEKSKVDPWFDKFDTSSEDEGIVAKAKKIGSKILSSRPIKRLLSGPSSEELGGRKLVGTPESEGSVLPKFKQPETYWGGFANSLYNDFIRPVGTPSGFLGSVQPKPIPRIDSTKVQAMLDAGMQSRRAAGLDLNLPKGLPSYSPSPIEKRVFYSGELGLESEPVKLPEFNTTVSPQLAVSGISNPNKITKSVSSSFNPEELAESNRLNSLTYGPAEQYPGSRLSIPYKNIIDTPTQSGDTRLGFSSESNANMEYPYTIVPNRFRPRTIQSNTVRLTPDRMKIGPISGIDSDINFISGEPEITDNLGQIRDINSPSYPKSTSTIFEQKSAIKQRTSKPQIKPTAEAVSGNSTAPDSIQRQPLAENHPYRPISEDAPVRDAVSQWAYGHQGAKVRASQIKQRFSNLSDESLIDKYESGDRSGGLDEVEKYLQERLKQGRDAGIFVEGQEVPNYLRHEYTQSPDEVQAAVKTYVSNNPSIARTRRFPTYTAAENAGLNRKYTSLPDVLGTYETKFNGALRNKEFYDWAQSTGRLKSGEAISSPSNWTFQGQDAPELAKLVGNVLGKSPEGLHKLANATSFTKNLYLGSGIPKTPLNMHMYNITRSDIMSRGIKKGLGDFFSGVFKPSRDVATIEKHTGDGLIADLVDHGMGWRDIEDHAALASGLQEPSVAKNILSKVSDFQQKVFEDPLFKIHLPAVKVRFASGRVKELMSKGLERETALTQAATEANDFYGGINKVLRNKTYTDLSRIGLLAPDWLESRANLAGKGISALVGKSDPLYAKALGRGFGMRVAGMGTTAALTGAALNKSKRATNSTDIPLGETATGKNRGFPIYGSAIEGLKIPEEILSGRDLGNVITSRISQPAKSAYHIVANEDAFGNPLRGRNKYGKKIGKVESIKRTGKEVLAPITPPWVLMLQQLLSGEDPEASIGTGLEMPLKYNREPKR